MTILSALAPFLFILGQWGMGPGPGTPALVNSPATLIQQNSGFNLASSVAVAYTSAPTAGHLLVVVGFVNVGLATTATVTDNHSCSWGFAAGAGASGSNNGSVGIWYCLSAAGGATTVTISGGGGNWYSLVVMEYPASSGFDVAGADATNNQATLTATASGPITGARDLIVFGVGQPNNNATFTTPTGFTSVAYVSGSFGIRSQAWYRTNLQTSGTPSASTTTSNCCTPSSPRVAIAAFKQ